MAVHVPSGRDVEHEHDPLLFGDTADDPEDARRGARCRIRAPRPLTASGSFSATDTPSGPSNSTR